MLVGNKADLSERREVPTEEGAQFATDNGISAFMEVSAKTHHEVEEAFIATANAIFEIDGANAENKTNGVTAESLLNGNGHHESGGCC
mmetsp:Transcript_20049/g.60752  ORF Transcript_20049/g.60752 Transcript_20049/m.60752 type:complete len:88 (-) Transcript_20049:454-717(-)